MERRLILVLLLFAVFAAAGGLELGATYSFQYNTTVLLSELRPRADGRGVKDVGYQILADAQCAVIWQHPADHQQQLLRITVTSPQLLVRSRRAPQPDGFAPHSSRLDSGGPVDVLLLTSSGGRPKLYRRGDRSEAESGLARGLVGLLTVRPEGQYRETDASGDCDVTYQSEGPQSLLKTKERCEAASPVHTSSHPVLDVSVTSERVTRYTLSGGQLEQAVSEERHSVTPAVRAGYGTLVTSLQTLQLTGRERSAVSVTAASSQEALLQLSEASLGWRPQETGLTAPASGTQRQCDADSPCTKLSELVSQLRSSLTEQSVASLSAAAASVALVPALRAASQDEVQAVLADKRNRQIRLSLLDAAGAAQTVAVHAAVRKSLSWPPGPSDDIEPHERYLVSLATASHPPQQLVKELVSESRRQQASPELHQTVVLTAASLAATLCSQTGDHQVCEDLSSDLTSQLRACGLSATEDDQPACCLLPLRGLTNLRAAAAVPSLIQQAMAADSRSDCRAEALRALSALPSDVTGPLRPDLERLYGQPDRYDVTSRLLAADLLLASPRAADAGRLLSRLGDSSAGEETAYILQRLRAAAAGSAALERSLRRLLADGRVANYDSLAQGALSSVLERKLWSAGGVSAGFSSALEVGKSRALRRSGFSAQLEAAGHRLDLLTFSVQAAGLSGIVGSPDPEDSADAQARLQLGLLGRQLRPRQLFSSQSELMGLLWSGAGSETTSALKGTVLLQDHLQDVPLQNGLSARLAVLAAVTFDLAGRIEVSLWNRNAQAELDNRAAVLLRGLATVHTPFVRARMEVSQALEARLDANTDMQFSDGPKTCARISHAPLVLREVVRKQERVPGSRHRLRRVRRQSRTWGGTTFSLNQQNADNCRAMFG